VSLPATIAQAILDTVIGRLALLFLAGASGDMAMARHAASQMIAAHNPETPDELTLAAEIISLQFHTLQALTDAADPELSLNKILRLRGGAVSLSRESHKARRSLDQLQRTRRAGATEQPAGTPAEAAQAPQSTPAKPQIDDAPGLLDVIRNAQRTDGNNWPQIQKRCNAQRITDTLKRNRAAAITAGPAPHPASLGSPK
jgi:hypothetical protein